jgi:hypothetical protein
VFIVFTDSPACAGGGLSVYTKFCTPSYLTGKKAASTIAAIESGETSIELTGTPELSLLELKEAVAWANEISNP